MKECELIFLNYKEYITFINLEIHDKSIKESLTRWYYHSWRCDYEFGIELKTKKIYWYIRIFIFNKNKIEEKKDLIKTLEEIEMLFINVAIGKEYQVFISEYKNIFQNKIENEILNQLSNHKFCFCDFWNQYAKGCMSCIIINKEKDDYLISKFIKEGETSLYVALGNI